MTKQPPTSLRIPDQTRQRVHAYAAERGIPRNAAYVEILDRGLAMLRSPNSTAPTRPPLKPPEPIKPKRLYETGEVNIPARQGFKTTIGPQRPAYGSRLKVKK